MDTERESSAGPIKKNYSNINIMEMNIYSAFCKFDKDLLRP